MTIMKSSNKALEICFYHSRAYLAAANSAMMLQTRYFFGFYYFCATA
jgi:hypothetical protein